MNSYSETAGSTSYEPEKSTTWIECQNCGKPVFVHLPFIGCVFCGDCMGGASSYIGTEDFTPRYSYV